MFNLSLIVIHGHFPLSSGLKRHPLQGRLLLANPFQGFFIDLPPVSNPRRNSRLTAAEISDILAPTYSKDVEPDE
jgi:hypothetical protein